MPLNNVKITQLKQILSLKAQKNIHNFELNKCKCFFSCILHSQKNNKVNSFSHKTQDVSVVHNKIPSTLSSMAKQDRYLDFPRNILQYYARFLSLLLRLYEAAHSIFLATSWNMGISVRKVIKFHSVLSEIRWIFKSKWTYSFKKKRL